MASHVKISSSVVARITKLQEPSTGCLLGILNDDTLFVIGFSKDSDTIKELKEKEKERLNVTSNLPAGVDFCGGFVAYVEEENNENDQCVKDILKSNSLLNPLILKVNLTSHDITGELWKDNKCKKIDFDPIPRDEVRKLFTNIRFTGSLTFSCDFQSESLQEAISALENQLTSGSAIYQFENSNIYLLKKNSVDVEVKGISSSSNVEDLISIHSAKKIDKQESKIKNTVKNQIESLPLKVFLKSSVDVGSPPLAPVMKYVKKNFTSSQMTLSIDALASVRNDMKIGLLHKIVTESVCRNLKLYGLSFLIQFSKKERRNISLPQIYHFLPDDFDHFISIAYPSKWNMDELLNVRKSFHMAFCLPLDRPYFRKGNSVPALQSDTNSSLIINPHVGLNASGVKDGEATLVQGNYAYHHYMQDRFDDNGWGCAYRSFQTIFSWFRFQGYTNMPIPSHKEVQQVLVDIGDKPSSFVGSRNWIGSTEISFVLDTMLGVSSRIVSVSSGEELSTKGGELSHHFRTQGTPVMIGGGVLAHTILGVDYNKKSGSIKFLILDPHYTGEEDINIIQNKGWCGWKGMEFWKKDSFYNMCLPLKPKGV